VPVLLMSGARTTGPMTRLVARLGAALRASRTVRFDDCGHMGPVTHAAAVDAAIASFLAPPLPRAAAERRASVELA
jgi:pimeloyl-ACP methyl ester carboxylesterase